MGYDDFTSLGKHFTAASKVLPWWVEFMKRAHQGIPEHNFPVPEGIVFAKIDTQTGMLALPTCPKVALVAFKKGTDPKELCPVDHLSQIKPEAETEEATTKAKRSKAKNQKLEDAMELWGALLQ